MDPEDLIAVGAVIKPHGLRGEVRVHPYNPESQIWGGLKTVYLQPEGGELRPYKVIRGRSAAKHAILELEGVVGRNEAEQLRGWEVSVSRDVLPPADDDEFYLVDLVGAAVVREGEQVGTVEKVLEYPSCLCLAVRSSDGLREVPILEPWTVRLDVDAGEVEVGPWDDLPVEA
ncbi:MAG: ribosome maturation factor RimM [Myxococcota bacterium]